MGKSTLLILMKDFPPYSTVGEIGLKWLQFQYTPKFGLNCLSLFGDFEGRFTLITKKKSQVSTFFEALKPILLR